MQIAGSTALVTGASKRIGRAIALSLAENGCNVAVHYLGSQGEAEETRDAIRGFGVRSQVIQADLELPDECVRLWQESIEMLGAAPNILINNASAFRRSTLDETTAGDFDQAIAVNVRAPMLLAQRMARDLGHAVTGKIVNINDRQKVYKSRFAYGITNAAMSGLTRSLAATIQVNELCLGPILPLTDDLRPGTPRMSPDTLGPSRRMGQLDEVSHAVISLLENDHINGASLVVDGGLSLLDQ